MTIQANLSTRHAGSRLDGLDGLDGVGGCATDKKRLVVDILLRGSPDLCSVTGARPSALKAPPLPGGADAPKSARPFNLESVGLGRDGTTSNDPEAARARAAVRGALGMPDNAALTPGAMADALKKKEPEILQALKDLGLTPGETLEDPATADAIKQVQQALGVEQTGALDLETLLAIVEAQNNQRSAARATPSPAARSSGSGGQTASGSGAGKPAGGTGGGAGGGLSHLPQRQPPGEPKRNLFQKAQDFAHDKVGIGPGSAPTGTLRANQQEAYDAAIGEGLSPTAAKALVANMTGESLAKPNDNHWDVSHMSQGIVQWDPSRSAAIKQQFGKEPKDMTVAEQTRAAIWEMKNKYPKTWQALQGSDPQQMISTLVRDYERPANQSTEIAKRMQHYNNLGAL